jgi:hypothetical protein
VREAFLGPRLFRKAQTGPSFRFERGQAGLNEAFPFAKRNESFRTGEASP